MKVDTVILLRHLYQIAYMQADLAEQELSMDIDWKALLDRLDKALKAEGIEVPEMPEMEEVLNAET